MLRRFCLSLLLMLAALTANSQSTFMEQLESDVEGQGRVRIERDARLDSLIGHGFTAPEGGQIKAIGYRVQVFAGNNTREARSKAQEAEEYIREYYPELPVYTIFRSPRWLCVVGDFLYYESAYEVLRTLKRDTPYKGLIVLKNQEINVSL